MRRLTIFAACLLAAVLVNLPSPAQDVITTYIGGGPNGIPAIDGFLYQPYDVAVDGSGNVYIAAYSQNRVFKVNTSGTISVVAGSGAQGYVGDGVAGGAATADLYNPFGVAVDTSGNVYISDRTNCVVREVNASTKTISTILGTGTCSSSAGNLSYPSALALDGSGDLFIADTNNCVIRKFVLSSKTSSVVAGSGSCGYSGDGGAATTADLYYPQGIAVDSAGDLFISDTDNCRIREVKKSTGNISTIAGTGTCTYSGDGNPATAAEIYYPEQIAINSAGTTATFADYNNHRIRQFTVGGNITTIAGNGTACSGTCGEGGSATSAELYYPIGIAVSGSNYYIGNNDNDVVDAFTVGGNLTRFAGNHSSNIETITNGAPANGVQFSYQFGIFNDTANNVYVADQNNQYVREFVNSTGLVNFFAGDGTAGYSGNSSTATDVEVYKPYGVSKDSSGNVYIADTYNCLIRKVTSAGAISNVAGYIYNGTSASQCGFSGDGESALSAKLYYPYDVTVDSKGNLYIADYDSHTVRKVSGGVISTIAGIGGINGYGGDGGPAVSALLYQPEAVAVDPAGNVFIADTGNCRVREIVAATGYIYTVAGNGACNYGGDGLATDNAVEYPQGVAVDANDNLFISDYTSRVRWVSPSGMMTTIAGSGTAGYYGDGGVAIYGELNEPTGIALDTAGNIIVSDYNNWRIRKVSVFPAVSTNLASLSYGLQSVGSTSSPQTLIVSAYGPVTISNISTTGAYSEADDCPSTLANGKTCIMYVYFTPTGSGKASGSVTINSNGFFNAVNTVALTGQGSAISLAGAPLAFGNQLVKTTSATKTVTVKNNGTTAVTMGAITSTNTTDYTVASNTCPASGATLGGGASCAIGVTFNPQSTGAKRGTIVINDSDPSSPQLVGLSGTGTSNVTLCTSPPSGCPTTVTFNTQAVTTTGAATKITVTNNTGANITLGNPAVTATGPFVIASTTTCTADLIIANTGTCVIEMEFKPTKVGFASGSVSVSDNDVTGSQSVTLQGYGTGVKFSPGSVTFGATNRGTQVSTPVVITNVGTTPIIFTGAEISGTNSLDFANNYNDSPPCGYNSGTPLQPGKTCQITIYFDPSIDGAESAAYKLFDNSVGSPQVLTLKGTGQN
jgi:trimeric autotransporter adhesin